MPVNVHESIAQRPSPEGESPKPTESVGSLIWGAFQTLSFGNANKLRSTFLLRPHKAISLSIAMRFFAVELCAGDGGQHWALNLRAFSTPLLLSESLNAAIGFRCL